MKRSTVMQVEAPTHADVARTMRALMAAEMLTASDLSRAFGGAVTYWTKRMLGTVPMTSHDIELVAWACGEHPVVFFGGKPPAEWTPPDPPPGLRCPHQDSNLEPSDYKSWFVFPEAV